MCLHCFAGVNITSDRHDKALFLEIVDFHSRTWQKSSSAMLHKAMQGLCIMSRYSILITHTSVAENRD